MTTMVMSSNGKLDKRRDVNPNTDVGTITLDKDHVTKLSKAKRRVKVYILKDGSWLDKGTGFCTGEVGSDRKPYFIVENELDPSEVILKAYLEGNTTYQRQQNTLIVWTDAQGNEIALSFQESEGCVDLCEFIIKVQQEDYSPDISLYYIISHEGAANEDSSELATEITELITGPVTYPPIPNMDNLEEVLDIINQASSINYYKCCIADYVVETNFIPQLIEVFNQSEAARNLVNLFTLSEIVKILIVYGGADTLIIDSFVRTESLILGIIGILEYDAEYPTQKACHREFLNQKRFRYVIDIPDLTDVNIFKKDYYLTFLKDILSRYLDEQTFTAVNNAIYANQLKVIDFLKDSKNNDNFLEKLFKIYKEENDIELKQNGVKLIHQYITSTKNIAGFQRTDFFSLLISDGLFDMIKYALNDEDLAIRVLGTELIVSIIKQDVSLVNSIDNGDTIDNSEPPIGNSEPSMDNKSSGKDEKEFGLKLSDDMTLMTLLAQVLLKETNFGIKTQAFEALKNLLDTNIGKVDENGAIPDYNANKLGNDISTEDYFKAFYNEVAPILYANLIELSNGEEMSGDIVQHVLEDQLLYQQLCELFSYCILIHGKTLQRHFFLSNNILIGLSRLLTTKCKMALKLSVVTCLSNVLAVNDKFYMRFIVKNKIIDEFFKFFETVKTQNNLANSTCLSLLEILYDIGQGKYKSIFKLLIKYIVDNYKETLNGLENVKTGTNLVRLYENLELARIKPNGPDIASGDLPTDRDIIEDIDEYEVDNDDDDDDDEDDDNEDDEYDEAFFDELRYDYEDRHMYGDEYLSKGTERESKRHKKDNKEPEAKNLFAEIQKDIDEQKSQKEGFGDLEDEPEEEPEALEGSEALDGSEEPEESEVPEETEVPQETEEENVNREK